MPLGVPSSTSSGLAAPQSAEVAAAAAAKQSLEPPKRVTVAVMEASSGVRFHFDASGDVSDFDAEAVKERLAEKLGVNATKVQLTVTSGSVSVGAYVISSNIAMLEAVRAVTGDTSALSDAVGIAIERAGGPKFIQMSEDGTMLEYHDWHIDYRVEYEELMASLTSALAAAFALALLLGGAREALQKRRFAGTASGGATATMAEDWAFDESAYSFFVAGVFHGSPKLALQSFFYAALTFVIQASTLRTPSEHHPSTS